MKKEFFTLFIFLFLLTGRAAEASPQGSSQGSSQGASQGSPTGAGITWLTNYDQAIKLGKQSAKPLLLFFTGSDWCGWCHKLEKEVLDTPEFIQATQDKLIFVKLDFPMHTELSPEITSQNEKLQEKYAVRSFPTIVILDPDQQPIGVSGYRSGGGKQYAQHLMKMVSDYATYQQQMQRLGGYHYSGKDLKRLYQKARELGLEADSNLLIRKGIHSDQSNFFLIERYRHLVHAGQMTDPETQILKKKLLESDPHNKFLTHYQVAIIDFEAYSEDSRKRSFSPDNAVAPLLAYIEKFGDRDKENLWRLNMVISQVFLDKNRYKEAVKYARASYSTAPATIQPEIATAIKNIQFQSKESF